MYDLILNDDEHIIVCSDDSKLKMNENDVNISVVITNKRLLFLNYPTDIESFRFGKMINHIYKKEVFFQTDINNIKKIEKGGIYTKYILNDSNFLYLCDNTIDNYFSERII